MPLNLLLEKLEKDFSYLMWRAQLHQHSSDQVLSKFNSLIDNYRPLVTSEDFAQFEALVERYQASI